MESFLFCILIPFSIYIEPLSCSSCVYYLFNFMLLLYTHIHTKILNIFCMVLNFTPIICYTNSILQHTFFFNSTLFLFFLHRVTIHYFVCCLINGYLAHFKLFSIENSALELPIEARRVMFQSQR